MTAGVDNDDTKMSSDPDASTTSSSMGHLKDEGHKSSHQEKQQNLRPNRGSPARSRDPAAVVTPETAKKNLAAEVDSLQVNAQNADEGVVKKAAKVESNLPFSTDALKESVPVAEPPMHHFDSGTPTTECSIGVDAGVVPIWNSTSVSKSDTTFEAVNSSLKEEDTEAGVDNLTPESSPQSIEEKNHISVPTQESRAWSLNASMGNTYLPPSNTEAEENARLQAVKDQQAKAEEDARIQAEQEADRQLDENVAKQRAEERARIQADREQERLKAETETRIMAEEEAQVMAEKENLRLASEAQARAMAEEQARLEADPKLGEIHVNEEANLQFFDEHRVLEPVETLPVSDAPVQKDAVSSVMPEADATENGCEDATLFPPITMTAEDKTRLQMEEEYQEEPEKEARNQADHEFNRQREEMTPVQQTEEEAPTQAAHKQEHLKVVGETQKRAEEDAQIITEEESRSLASKSEARKPADVKSGMKAGEESSNPAVKIQDQTQTMLAIDTPTEDDSIRTGKKWALAEVGLQDTSQSAGLTAAMEENDDAIDMNNVTSSHNSDTPNSRENNEEEEMETDEQAFCGISLDGVCGAGEEDEQPKPYSVFKARSGPVSFASAFGGKPAEDQDPTSVSVDLKSGELTGTPPSAGSDSPSDVSQKSDTSLTAFGAAKSKRVSSLVNTYVENVSKEALPGDTVQLQSSLKDISYWPRPSPITHSSSKSLDVEAKDLPKIGNIRAKFEGSSKGQSNLLFGEAFRQQQRFSMLAEKQRKKEAQMKMRGYDEWMLAQLRTDSGEIDTAQLGNTFAFQAPRQDVALHDGTCKVDYKATTYQAMVFVVHNARGMLLLNHYDNPKEENASAATHIPGGEVKEEEFLAAAKLTGYAKMQLQLAAREGASRQLFETTGIDVQKDLNRLTPAVLQMNPSVDPSGIQNLKNEHENRLYYFLQVTDSDFVKDDSDETKGNTELTVPNGELESQLKLRLAGGFADYTFVKDPRDAAIELKENGDPDITTALHMVMNQSVGQDWDPNTATAYTGGTKNAPATRPGQVFERDEWTGGMTVQNAESPKVSNNGENDLKQKGSTDSAQQEVVTCCCGFW